MHGAAQLATWIGFLQGAKVMLVRKFDPVDVMQTAERERANSLSIVGDAMARPLAEALEGPMAGADLSSVYAISSAGAILSGAVRDKLQSLLPKHDAASTTSAPRRPASRAPASPARARTRDCASPSTRAARCSATT